MWEMLLSAVNSALGFVFRTANVKFVLFFALFYAVHEFAPVLASWLPDASSLTSALGLQAPHVWFFLDMFEVSEGVSMLLSAWMTRFSIRRTPLLG